MELQKLMEHFFHLYGPRNRIHLPGLRERLDFLNLGIGNLGDAIRMGIQGKLLREQLARVVARIFCIAEHFRNLPLVEVMARKYPAAHCSYCLQLPCVCPERRPDPQLAHTVHQEQLAWSLTAWSHHCAILYGEKNRARGINYVLNRLFKEVCELLRLLVTIPRSKSPPSKIEEEFALELADTLAWTIAVANLLEQDLDAAVWERYGKGCSWCHKNPCVCTDLWGSIG
ncbi:MAG: hypothetical protein HY459_02220 [Parcubacteria group bacterium]|nr:hypothetical protein [Parcubacteria group bacterium]